MNRKSAKTKLEPTAVDAIITAVSPALIIGMISSLVFFLIVAFYRGEYDSRLMYILGLYIFATVLVARIAIEDGRAHANWFGIPLFGAACIAVFRFVSISGPLAGASPIINVGLLLLAWYLADRITYDCTLVDERDQSIQKGLLQSLHLVGSPDASEATSNAIAAKGKSPGKGNPKRKKRKHNPGVWVLYFALLAIPLFGLGQITIPDENARFDAFKFLLIYLACALGLLLTTSFVGMRRYLRQRGVEMPSELSRLWLGCGAAGILVLLVACLILPMPTKQGVGFAWLPIEFASPQGLSPSKWGWGNEGPSASEEDSAQSTNDPHHPVGEEAQPEGKGPPKASDNARQDGPKSQESDAKNPGQDSNSKEPERADDRAQQAGDKQTASESSSNKSDQASDSPKDGRHKPPQPSKPEQSDQKSEQHSDQQSDQKSDRQSDQKSDQKSEQPSQKPPSQAEARPEAQQPNPQPQKRQPQKPENREDLRKNAQPPRTTPPPSSNASGQWLSAFGNLSALLKWILIAILAAIVLIYALLHPHEIAKLWNDLLKLFSGLFGGKRTAQQITPENVQEVAHQVAIRPFNSFADPFVTESNMSPVQVVAHTFAALEAWANEHGGGRAADQTAEEFARRLARQQPKVGSHATGAAQMLDRMMFSDWRPTRQDIASLSQLWQILRSS